MSDPDTCPGCDQTGDIDEQQISRTDQRVTVEIYTCPNPDCRVREYYRGNVGENQ